MLAIEVNFLTGRYVATAHNDRNGHEWPPHPARLYSALVDAWADEGEDVERQALEWLEAQPAPQLTCSEATPRSTNTHFVPVNDTSIVGLSLQAKRGGKLEELYAESAALEEAGGRPSKRGERLQNMISKQRDVVAQVTAPGSTSPDAAEQILPDGRNKQPRSFPSVTPEEPRVTYMWDGEPSQEVRASLDNLLMRVARLGHSSSLVSCRLVAESPTANYVPGAGSEVLRWVGTGQLVSLERQRHLHQGNRPRSLPFSARRYGRVARQPAEAETTTPNTAGDWIVFEFLAGSRRFPATRTVEVADTLRKGAFAYAEDPIPEGLSGHQTSGVPTSMPHVAFMGIPYVGYEHADGRLVGAAIGLPNSLDERSRRAVLRAVGRWERSRTGSLQLNFGRGGSLEFERKSTLSSLLTLRPRVWSIASRRWMSVTPVALPRNPGTLSTKTHQSRTKAWARAEEAIVASCHHVGLPEPARVVVSLSPFVRAARPAFEFPAFLQRGRDGRAVARRLVHAAVEFDSPVAGPLLLGSGRFIGLGLMRPVAEADPTVEGGVRHV